MKRLMLISFTLVGLMLLSSCRDVSQKQEVAQMVNVSIGERVFQLQLVDSPASHEFTDRLPLTIEMIDVNQNEKYARLDAGLTRHDEIAHQIEEGDVKLWSGDGLVIFYESFESSYAYTNLGYIVNTEGLKESLGQGDVRVSFTLAQ